MGVELWDIINKNDTTLLKFKLTKKDFNKWGEFIEINYQNLYMYPKEFMDALKLMYGIPDEIQDIGINITDRWFKKKNPNDEHNEIVSKYENAINLLTGNRNVTDDEMQDIKKAISTYNNYINGLDFEFNVVYLTELFNRKETVLKKNGSRVRIIKLEKY